MFVLKLYITDHSRYLIVFFINIFWTLIMSLTLMLDFGKTHWWLVRVTLVVAFGFFSTILEGSGDLRMVFCILLMQVQWWGHHQVVEILKRYHNVWTFCTYRWRGFKNIPRARVSTLAPSLVPFTPTSHLVEFPPPNNLSTNWIWKLCREGDKMKSHPAWYQRGHWLNLEILPHTPWARFELAITAWCRVCCSKG